MEFIMVCPNCAKENAVSAFSCISCRYNLAHIEPTQRASNLKEPGPAAQKSKELVPGKRVCTNPECQFPETPEHGPECLICGRSFVVSSADSLQLQGGKSRQLVFEIRFQFGSIRIDRTEGILRIGREITFSPVADRLSSFDKVSRRHAELSIRENQLLVTDLPTSTNHVFVNGTQIPVNVPTSLSHGDRVSFSRQLTGTVVVEED